MKISKVACDLKTCFLCQLCQKEWIPALDAHRKNFVVKKGDDIFQEGEAVKGIFFVYEGAVKVHKQWGEKELIVRFAKRGAIIGHRGLGRDLIYPVTGTAIESTKLCFVEMDFFQASLKVNHALLYELMEFFAAELKESERNMRNLAHMPVKSRIAQCLLLLDEKFGHTPDGFLNISLSRQDLASYAGTSYETAFRVMNEFVEENAISIQDKRFIIHSRALLEQHSI
ncbi:Crp/Fnr family transcriptional regulator [Flavisolibacter ginsenosidimutans]|uniref:Crp/Fnr family transcriptional regulator n=1 Tax=Flavisolibacter ginsenosidimutans TaxID=661481 RepID=A0A5B8UI60_9BACT|nr:Crp/Fnr family transcriptional regulator [Flavisolibacter ginsenosidimutans]QEC56122.1 Crp/Fnr family transcriptional regulator [Flavisolibacter ginsenosidimutans]